MSLKDLYYYHFYNLVRLIGQVIEHEELTKKFKEKESKLSKKDYQNELTKMSSEILKRLSDVKRGGRHPFILTGAVIYLADWLLSIKFNQKKILTQKIVSEATKIPEYSIRDHYTNLLKPIFLNNKAKA